LTFVYTYKYVNYCYLICLPNSRL